MNTTYSSRYPLRKMKAAWPAVTSSTLRLAIRLHEHPFELDAHSGTNVAVLQTIIELGHRRGLKSLEQTAGAEGGNDAKDGIQSGDDGFVDWVGLPVGLDLGQGLPQKRGHR